MVVADRVRFGGSGRAKRFREFGSSCEGHTVNALASGGDEGRRSLRYAPSSWQASDDTGMSEWGNPIQVMLDRLAQTRGTEPSKYPVERKSTETLLVAASERGRA